MAETLTGPISITQNLNLSGPSASGLGTINYAVSPTNLFTANLISGVAAALAVNQVYATLISLTAASPVSLNLYTMSTGSAPNDAIGNAFTMAVLKGLMIQNVGATSPVETDTVVMDGGGSGAGSTFLASLLSTDTSGIILPSPPSTTAPPTTLIFLAPGVVGWAVASGAGANSIRFTANTHNQKIQVIAFGSTS